MPDIALEICVDEIAGLHAAIAGGADRIELCAALETGGLTPGAGLLRAAAAAATATAAAASLTMLAPVPATVPVYAMVRPRGGDFCYDAAERELMVYDIEAVAAAGLQGVVLGVSLADGRLDHHALESLLCRARDLGLGATLHRAVDLCPDLAQATATAAGLGFERMLTSGGARSAVLGMDGLRRCFDAAAGRIAVMPGAGIDAATVGLLRAALPLTQVHASCSEPLEQDYGPLAARLLAFGFESGKRRRTSRDKVAALKAALKVTSPAPSAA